MHNTYVTLIEKIQELESKLAQERADKHYWLGYTRGIANSLPEPERSRVLKKLENLKKGEYSWEQ